jgi:hypothetical protein
LPSTFSECIFTHLSSPFTSYYAFLPYLSLYVMSSVTTIRGSTLLNYEVACVLTITGDALCFEKKPINRRRSVFLCTFVVSDLQCWDSNSAGTRGLPRKNPGILRF